jgi:hypothetical protein
VEDEVQVEHVSRESVIIIHAVTRLLHLVDYVCVSVSVHGVAASLMATGNTISNSMGQWRMQDLRKGVSDGRGREILEDPRCLATPKPIVC